MELGRRGVNEFWNTPVEPIRLESFLIGSVSDNPAIGFQRLPLGGIREPPFVG